MADRHYVPLVGSGVKSNRSGVDMRVTAHMADSVSAQMNPAI
ncbi:hypothetical protein SM191_10265 [Sphingomonas sp. 2378]|nr:hypothetical protein [Sphingomonas sp. SORGH_AS_0870]MDR6147622.1 hypothetical protein [Sphingomonas sp. SORGH_AS_0870]